MSKTTKNKLENLNKQLNNLHILKKCGVSCQQEIDRLTLIRDELTSNRTTKS